MNDPLNFVVFDLGGVLVKTRPTWELAARAAGVKIRGGTGTTGQNLLLEQFQVGELSEDQYFTALADFLECSFDEAQRVHMACLVGEFPGVLSIVQRLVEEGRPTGCLSNTNAPHWRALLRYPAIALLGPKMASHEVGVAKPDRRIFDHFKERFGVGNRPVTYFDDGERNVEAALAVGWIATLIDAAHDPAAQIRSVLGWE